MDKLVIRPQTAVDTLMRRSSLLNSVFPRLLLLIIIMCTFHVAGQCPRECRACQSQRGTVVSADCSGLGLTDLPHNLPTSLLHLDISRNKIGLLCSASLSGLVNLLTLDASYNIISSLEDCPPTATSQSDLSSLERSTVRGGQHVSPLLVTLASGHHSYQTSALLHLTNLTKLFLQHNNVRTIPNNCFLTLTSLQVLDISFNKLTRLEPKSLRGLFSLESLDLMNNSIVLIPDAYPDEVFRDLGNLTTLNIRRNLKYWHYSSGTRTRPNPFSCHHVDSDNYIYPDKALSLVPSLQNLFMDALSVDVQLGPGFRKLTNLRILDLGNPGSRCLLDALNEDTFSNINTTRPLKLLLTDCVIKSIHNSSFSKLPTLRSLSLKGNTFDFSIFEIGSESLKHTQIKELDISRIHRIDLMTLHSEYLHHLTDTALETLIMEDNSILKIEKKVPVMLPHTLKTWDISWNKIMDAHFFDSLYFMPNLELFNLSVQNKYTLHTEEQKESVSLELKPGANSKEDIDMVYDELVSSDSLTAAYDIISVDTLLKLQKGFCSSFRSRPLVTRTGPQYFRIAKPNRLRSMLSVLKKGLQNNNTSLPRTPFKTGYPFPLPRSLRKVYGSELKLGYSIPSFTFRHNKVEVLDLSKNFLWCFDGPVDGLTELQQLNLSNNYCIGLSPYFFRGMLALRKLFLAFNSLGPSLELSSRTFSELHSLEYLDLSHNDIRSLRSDTLAFNSRLRSLNLAFNYLRKFQPRIGHIRNLSYLDLSKNGIQFLSSANTRDLELLSKTANVTVNLSKNPLSCGCDALEFLFWYRTHQMMFSSQEEYTCRFVNSSQLRMHELEEFLFPLWRICHGPSILIITLIIFLIVLIVWSVAGIAYYHRFQLLFYFYISKARFLAGPQRQDHVTDSDLSIVYDDQELKWRRFVWEVVKPALESRQVSCYFSEINEVSAGRPTRDVIEESVFRGRKCLVLLSADLFQFEENQMEVALAGLAERMLGRRVLLFMQVEPVGKDRLPPFVKHYLTRYEPIAYRWDVWDRLVEMIKN